jgi:hypothetical protein
VQQQHVDCQARMPNIARKSRKEHDNKIGNCSPVIPASAGMTGEQLPAFYPY